MGGLRIGIDVHGVADADREFFSDLTRLLVESGHEVHILTGSEHTLALETILRDRLGLRWTHLFSITTHHKTVGTAIDFIDGNPFMDEETWNRTKAEYCRINKVQLHIDDSPVYGRTFETPYARYAANRRPEKKRRIAILGGSFNPVTNAHLAAARAVLDRIPEMDHVWLMPAYRHPFAKHRNYASHRIRMLRMVETRRIRYFGYEIDNRLSGETYFTFTRLLEDPEYMHRFDFSMIIGSDCVLDFDHKWKHAAELAETVPFIIVPRPGYDLAGYGGLLSTRPHLRLEGVDIPDISATQVRRRIRRGLPVDHLVPAPVNRFIQEHGLYRDDPAGEARDGDVCPTVRREISGDSPPLVTVDVAVCTIRDGALKVLLVRRDDDDGGCWSLPGGPPDSDDPESLEAVAAGLLERQTGLRDIYIEQLRTYGRSGGSSTGRMITVAYFALVPDDKLDGIVERRVKIGQTEAHGEWFSLRGFEAEMDALGHDPAVGHDRILKDLSARLRGKISYAPIAFELVPKRFTWPELRRVYEIVLGKSLDATNFKRKIRSAYRIRDLKPRRAAGAKGRPPNRLAFEGIREIYT